MIEILPMNCGLLGYATFVYVIINSFSTEAQTCGVLYYVYNQDKKELLNQTYELTPEEYAGWGTDNTYVENIVLNLIGATRA